MQRLALRLNLLCVLGLVAVGCAGPRALHMVRESGDRAFARGDYQTALAEYREVVQRSPADWRTRVELARTQLVLNDADAARENLAVAHRLRPEDDSIVDLLATAMLESEKVAEMHDLLRLRAKEKGRVSDYLRLGFFMAKAGDLDAAEQALKTAARIDRGQHVEPELALADFYQKVGDEEAALLHLRHALWIDPTNETVVQRIRKMGEVPGPSLAIQPPDAP